MSAYDPERTFARYFQYAILTDYDAASTVGWKVMRGHSQS